MRRKDFTREGFKRRLYPAMHKAQMPKGDCALHDLVLFIYFSMISFQKSEIVSVTEGGICIVFEKQTVQIGRDLRRTDPFVNGEVP